MTDQFLVLVPRRAGLDRNHLAARHRLHEADHGNDERSGQQRARRFPADDWRNERRQASRDLADNTAAAVRKTDRVTHPSQQRDREEAEVVPAAALRLGHLRTVAAQDGAGLAEQRVQAAEALPGDAVAHRHDRDPGDHFDVEFPGGAPFGVVGQPLALADRATPC